MNIHSIAKNLSYALVAQLVSLAVSFCMSLLVPKVLGVEEFGFWQLFIFYSSYVGIFHFGLNDGVYLIKGGQREDEIDKSEVKAQFIVGLCIELVFAVGISIASMMLLSDGDRLFVVVAVSAYLVLKNSADYFGYVFQAINETSIYSVYTMVDRACFLVPLIVLVCLNVSDYRAYVLLYLSARVISLIYCLHKAKSFLNSKPVPVSRAFDLALSSARVGIKLLIANLTSMLILGVSRGLIDAVWGIEAFGQLSLSLSLVNFVLVFATQFAMVLFPALRQVEKGEQVKLYQKVKAFLRLVTPIIYLAYFPLFLFIVWWLPQYEQTAIYLGVLLPICVFDTKMNVLGTTFLKVLRKEGQLLACNCACLAVSSVLAAYFSLIAHSIDGVVWTMSFVIAARCVFAEYLLKADMDSRIDFIDIAEILLSVGFVVLSATCSFGIAFSFVFAFSSLYLFALRSEARELFTSIKGLRRGKG